MNGQNPYEENLQNPLEKYGRDIVKAVKDGKIDPIIGRDDKSSRLFSTLIIV